MKLYEGYREYAIGRDGVPARSTCHVRVHEDGGYRPLAPRHDIRNHSPTGFEWGYGGSGPAQLALALVADACGSQLAVPAVYQRVKEHVAKLPHEGWELSLADVTAWILVAMVDAGMIAGGAAE